MPARTIPYDFNMRSYQREVFQARACGVDRLLLVWPRRAGKDKPAVNLILHEGSLKWVGVYLLIAPLYSGEEDLVARKR